MKRVIFGAALALSMLGGAGFAQNAQTLADIRQEAAVLSVEIAKLKRELSTTGAPNTQFAGASTLERVDLMEAALANLTAKVEGLEFRVDQVVKDGTNQLDDLNFRLCELESGCDVGSLPPLTPLGGATGASDVVVTGPGSEPAMEGGGDLAMAEQSDYDAAMALYTDGEYAQAATAFANFAQSYTGGYLTGEAHFMRGESYAALGQTADAARAYLDSFSGSPEGDRAPDALLRLAGSLGKLGQVDKGCVMYREVQSRFPGSDAASAAVREAQTLGCQQAPVQWDAPSMSEVTAKQAMLKHCVATAFAYDKPAQLAVAVSGGGDSMALLHLMAEWAEDEKIRLWAVTVNHGLRPEAAEEARFVSEVAQKLQVKHTTLTWSGWSGQGNLQDAARRARYRLMADWAKAEGINTIALAHTADDQAETFFMRLARASGIDGLTGMQRRRVSDGITWVRPLLMQERFELRQYLRDLRQPWIDDPSNDNEAFDRIKARRAMEELSKLGIDIHVVGRVMDHLGQVRSALDFATHDHALDCVSEDQGDLILNRRRFAEGAPEINRRLVAHALRWIASADYGPRGMKLQEFLSAMMRGRDATLHGVRLLGGKESFRLTREHAAVAHTVAVPGAVWDGRWIVEGIEDKGLIVRAMGQDGLLQLGELPDGAPPRETLSASPAVFDGNTLISAPLVRYGPATLRLAQPKGDFFTTLLSH